MITTLIMVVLLVGIAVILLALQILFKKNGKFPNTHIEGNEHLQKYGITCATNDEYECSVNKASGAGCEGCSFMCENPVSKVG